MQISTTSALIESSIERLGLSEILPQRLRGMLQLQTFQKDEYVVRSGHRPQGISVLISGKVQVMPLSEDGTEIILNYLYPLDVIGDMELLLSTGYIHSVRASMKTAALFLPLSVVTELMENSPPFLRFMLQALNAKVMIVSKYSSNSRLYGTKCSFCRFLYEQKLRLNSDLIPILMKQAAIYIGVSERHLRRIVREMEEEGLIEKLPRQIRILDPEALRRQIAEF